MTIDFDCTYNIVKQTESNTSTKEWNITSDSNWTYVTHYAPIPNQGWKVHISTIPQKANEVLMIASTIAIEQKISFKYLKSSKILSISLRKYADRNQAGKFIAFYPRTISELRQLVDCLTAELKDFPGPDILTDCRIGQAPVHLRYGAFHLEFTRDDYGHTVPALRAPDGNLVPDERRPAFYVPNWVEIPDWLDPHIQLRTGNTLPENAFAPYKIRSALHYSNGGAVFLADIYDVNGAEGDKSSEQVVLKEARPWCAPYYFGLIRAKMFKSDVTPTHTAGFTLTAHKQ